MLHNRLLQDKEMTVKHDCDKSSCRTFLSHRVFIIIYIFKSNIWRLYDIQVRREKALGDDSYGAFPLHGTVRYGSARLGTVRYGSVAFPPQFSTAIEWAGLFPRRYNCAASTAVTSS